MTKVNTRRVLSTVIRWVVETRLILCGREGARLFRCAVSCPSVQVKSKGGGGGGVNRHEN